MYVRFAPCVYADGWLIICIMFRIISVSINSEVDFSLSVFIKLLVWKKENFFWHFLLSGFKSSDEEVGWLFSYCFATLFLILNMSIFTHLKNFVGKRRNASIPDLSTQEKLENVFLGFLSFEFRTLENSTRDICRAFWFWFNPGMLNSEKLL